jgi:HSP20 family protein
MTYELTTAMRRGSIYRESTTDPIAAIQDQALRAFQQLLASNQRQDGGQNNIVPPAEALEDNSTYVLRLEIPGVNPNDVDVNIIGNTLSIKAERRRYQSDAQQQQTAQTRDQQAQQPRHLLFSEIPNGIIRREFQLPEDADRQKLNAEVRNGVLNLTIPKSQETTQRRHIEIKATAN